LSPKIRALTDNGRNAVNPCRPPIFNYDPLAWANAIRRVSGLLVMALALVPLIWLDQTRVQLFGFALYPIEHGLNAVLFPGVTTPLRGNGTALLILAPTLALLAFVFGALRSLYAIVRAAVYRVIGPAR
jgi:hypothetical protein